MSAGRRAALAALSTVVLHVLFVALMVGLSHLGFFSSPHVPPPQAVTMRTMTADQWQKNRGNAAPVDPLAKKQPKPKEREPEKKPDTKPNGQVVDIAPGNNQESEDAKYLAEKANKTAKETRAKEQTADYRNAMPQRTRQAQSQTNGQDEAQAPQMAGNNGTGQDGKPGSGGQNQLLIPKITKQDSVVPKVDDKGPGTQVARRDEREDTPGNSNRLQVPTQPGEAGSAGQMGQPGARTLMPSMAVLDKISGAAPNDHLRDVEEGEGTFLNAKEWKYASFFNRVKQSVGMHWNPGQQLAGRDPTGNIYGVKDRYTVVQVALTQRGTVKEIFVEKSCGIDFLDLEAVQSFERAQPFPNPPPGLADADQLTRFSFGFFVEMGAGSRMRIFRQAN